MPRSTNRQRSGLPRTGFSLLELILVLALTIVLLASYVRALDEVEEVDAALRNDSLPRLAKGRLIEQAKVDLSPPSPTSDIGADSGHDQPPPAAAVLVEDAQTASAEGLTASPSDPHER